MAYEVVMSYHLHMPSYFLGTFTEYPYINSINWFYEDRCPGRWSRTLFLGIQLFLQP